MKKLLTLLLALSLVLGLSACKDEKCDEGYSLVDGECVVDTVENEAPVIAGADAVTIQYGDVWNELTGVTATDAEDGDLTAEIYVSGEVNLVVPGTYTLTYSVTDKDGQVTSVDRAVTLQSDYVFPTGFYNYKFASSDLRHELMAVAERFMMETMYGGIPLFASGSFALYSDRLALPVDDYIAVMGFGTSFGTMTADDSTVLMDDGEAGVAGEYTYRTTVGANPGTFNQWLYDTSTDSDLMSVYYDALYEYVFNADKTGYEVVGSMAAGVPVPVGGETLDTGKVVSDVWEVTLRDDLVWKFHPETVQAFLDTNPDTVIDAHDFIDTFELALTEEWFRAVSGGGDFINGNAKIKNAQEFVDGSADWADVGLKVKDGDDLTMVFTFVDQQSEWNVKYFLSSFVMTPINLELYNYLGTGLGEDEVNPYGTTEKNVAYHGAFYVDYYEADKIVRMKENDVYYDTDKYFYTGYNFSVITDQTIIFSEFIAGKLESTGLPTAEVENYENDPRLKRIPGATTYRLMINGLGSVEEQRAQFPDGEWIPEPILAHPDMKSAMFFALDRQKLAEEILKVRTTNMYYFSNAYLVEPEEGVPYRQTEAGQTVGEGLSPDTYGYNFDAAQALYQSAVEDLVMQGLIEAGTESNPTIITIELNNYSNSESWDLACAYIKTAYEAAFQDDTYNVNVQVDIYTKDFPAIYYDYMMIGEFDTSVGGISGSTLDAASFLDTYSSDNRSGFTINWGFDTGIANIAVNYTDDLGVEHKEIWSYDALQAALNGEIYVVDGAEAVIPAAKNVEVTPTTVSFTIDQFDNVTYSNIKYTIQAYDIAADAYNDVAGYVDLTPAAADVTVTGLTPFQYVTGIDGSTVYEGDYQIKVTFDYANETDRSGSSISPWFEMGALLSDVTVEATLETASLSFGINTDDADRTVASIKAFYEMTPATDDDAAVWAEDTNAVVDFADLSAIAITVLMPETDYVLEVKFSDDEVAYIEVSTNPILVAGEVKATQTFAIFDITLDEDYEGVLTSAVVKDSEGNVVAGAAVDFGSLDMILVTGLEAGTDYVVELTFDDAEVRMVAVSTEAAPAAE